MSEEDGRRSLMVGRINYSIGDGMRTGELTPNILLADLESGAIDLDDIANISVDGNDEALVVFWVHLQRIIASSKRTDYVRLREIAINKLREIAGHPETFDE